MENFQENKFFTLNATPFKYGKVKRGKCLLEIRIYSKTSPRHHEMSIYDISLLIFDCGNDKNCVDKRTCLNRDSNKPAKY